jgi:hypothetical protein
MDQQSCHSDLVPNMHTLQVAAASPYPGPPGSSIVVLLVMSAGGENWRRQG